ncbi:cysteine--tRNA ligase 2, cytoplasmic-like [Rosa rugosa]|uniref:cysteine--tRNA ligase 2, cytoplasmic-like n=1 Tax=Rosa rugosa TaxID=74645 RepID=UPI002B41066C|nr:cysteine--tRNA ligase 2, cytoplasmic-like [Rosa rugosa]
MEAVKIVLSILGLLSSHTYSEVVQEYLKAKALERAELSEDDVLHTIADRTLARKNKDYAKSDQIRVEMEKKAGYSNHGWRTSEFKEPN